jgi:hypothetical protein
MFRRRAADDHGMFQLLRRPSRVRGRGLSGRVAVRSDRDRRALRRELRQGLHDLAEGAAQPDAVVLDVQIVVQVCASSSYGPWKAEREKAWRKQGGRYTTATWPQSIQPDAYGLLLLPLAAGRVGVSVGKYPQVVADPVCSSGHPPHGGTYDDLVLGLVTSWVGNPAPGMSARLAPPVIEVVQRGRITDRRLEDFAAEWPLVAPDGL